MYSSRVVLITWACSRCRSRVTWRLLSNHVHYRFVCNQHLAGQWWTWTHLERVWTRMCRLSWWSSSSANTRRSGALSPGSPAGQRPFTLSLSSDWSVLLLLLLSWWNTLYLYLQDHSDHPWEREDIQCDKAWYEWANHTMTRSYFIPK